MFHAPLTRSGSVLVLLEELGAPYDLQVLDRAAGEHLAPAYLAINPMGKVPALRDGEAVVTETVAIFIYLADLHAEAALAPPLGDPLRGPYLRWLVFYAACFEPAVIDRSLGHDPGPRSRSPYGDYDLVIDTLAAQLAAGPYLLGERFSAADVLWACALAWTVDAKLVPERPDITNFVRRVIARPAFARAWTKDRALAAGGGA